MALKIKYWAVLTGIFLSFAFTSDEKIISQQIIWKTYYINSSIVDDTAGAILLFENKKGKLFNNLNLFILNNSQLILAQQKYDLSSEKALRKIFVKNIPYEIEHSVVSSNLHTQILYCKKNLLSYFIRQDYKNDKGSPYYEYLNIDIRKNIRFTIHDLIRTDRYVDFKAFVYKSALKNKRQILKSYKNTISERADPLLAEEYEIFDNPDYTLEKLSVHKPDSIELISLTEKGMEVSINIVDRNFKKYKEGYIYKSSLNLPYQDLRRYLDPKSSIFL